MGLSRSTVRLLILAAFYVLFLVIGASIFSAIEEPKEIENIKKLRSLRTRFINDHACISGKNVHIRFFVDFTNPYA